MINQVENSEKHYLVVKIYVTFFLHFGKYHVLSSNDAFGFLQVREVMAGVMASVYLMPLIKVTELVSAILLLIGRTAPLGAIIIFPVTLNIFLYHAFLGPQQLPMVAVMLIFNIFLLFAYHKKYLPIISK